MLKLLYPNPPLCKNRQKPENMLPTVLCMGFCTCIILDRRHIHRASWGSLQKMLPGGADWAAPWKKPTLLAPGPAQLDHSNANPSAVVPKGLSSELCSAEIHRIKPAVGSAVVRLMVRALETWAQEHKAAASYPGLCCLSSRKDRDILEGNSGLFFN